MEGVQTTICESATETYHLQKGVLVIDERRVNHRIRARSILVVGANGEPLGEMTPQEAIRIAREDNMDLVEVAPNARPPVCKIMDYGKFKYQKTKRQASAKKKQKTVQLKEVKFRVKTDEHDYQFKVNHIKRFLEGGDKAKATIMFRGRESAHPELGRKILDRVAQEIAEVGTIETPPKHEGRNLFMIIAPRAEKKSLEEKEEARKKAAEEKEENANA